MALPPMAPGGQWLKPPFEGPAQYLGPRQMDGHLRRLTKDDGWEICGDPRVEGDQSQVASQSVIGPEVALQARIDQLESQLQQLLAMFAMKNEQDDASTNNDVSTHSEGAPVDSRSKRGKSNI